MKAEIKQRIAQFNNGEVPQGYKVTTVGIVPQEWAEHTLGDIFTFKNGLNKEKEAFGEGTPIVNYTDVWKKRGLRTKDIKGRVTLSSSEIENYEAKCGDVFFTRTSETIDEIGYSSVLLEDIENAVFSGFVLRARPYNDLICKEYHQYCYSQPNMRHEIIKRSSMTTRALTSGPMLSQVSINIPSVSEQSKIAEILMKWDEAIELQEQYIGTLENRKKFLIKKLLTPKGNWSSVKLGNIAEMYAGGTPSTQKSEYWGGEIPWIQSGLIQNGYIDIENIDGRITEQGLKKSSATWIAKNSVLVAITGATCANIAYLRCDATANQSVISITTNAVDSLFLYFYLQSTRNKLLSLQNGSAQGGLTLKYLQNFEIMYPELSEQKKIGSILSNVDVEISMQKDIVLKLKNQRKALQQYLLNGIVRVNK